VPFPGADIHPINDILQFSPFAGQLQLEKFALGNIQSRSHGAQYLAVLIEAVTALFLQIPQLTSFFVVYPEFNSIATTLSSTDDIGFRHHSPVVGVDDLQIHLISPVKGFRIDSGKVVYFLRPKNRFFCHGVIFPAAQLSDALGLPKLGLAFFQLLVRAKKLKGDFQGKLQGQGAGAFVNMTIPGEGTQFFDVFIVSMGNEDDYRQWPDSLHLFDDPVFIRAIQQSQINKGHIHGDALA